MDDIVARQQATKEEIVRMEEAAAFFDYWTQVSGVDSLYSYMRGAIDRVYFKDKPSKVSIVPVHTPHCGIRPALNYWSGNIQKQITVMPMQNYQPGTDENCIALDQTQDIEPGVVYCGKANANGDIYGFMVEWVGRTDTTNIPVKGTELTLTGISGNYRREH